jgi:hypothetical protein
VGKDVSGQPLPSSVSVYVSEQAVSSQRHRAGHDGPDATDKRAACGLLREFKRPGIFL